LGGNIERHQTEREGGRERENKTGEIDFISF
jgi:hypothetical protein